MRRSRKGVGCAREVSVDWRRRLFGNLEITGDLLSDDQVPRLMSASVAYEILFFQRRIF